MVTTKSGKKFTRSLAGNGKSDKEAGRPEKRMASLKAMPSKIFKKTILFFRGKRHADIVFKIEPIVESFFS